MDAHCPQHQQNPAAVVIGCRCNDAPATLVDPVTPGLRTRVAGKRGDDIVWMPAGEMRAMLTEYDRRGQIEQRAQLIAGGRPARPDRHVALALSVTDGPSPKQAAFTANWILTGGPS